MTGFGSLGGVAMRLMYDYVRNRTSMGPMVGKGLEEAIDWVCFQQKTLASPNPYPSYVWWECALLEGEPQFVIDRGKKKKRDPWDYTVCDEVEAHSLMGEGENWNMFDGELERPITDSTSFSQPPTRFSVDSVIQFMLTNGITFGQKILTRYYEWWPYQNEFDDNPRAYSEVLYVEPTPRFHIIPQYAEIAWAPGDFKKMTVL